MNINPKVIRGNWTNGWALDVHTSGSIYIGIDEWGHKKFDTTYTEIGEALNKLKYGNDRTQVDPIAKIVTEFIRTKRELDDIRAILAVPPSDTKRRFQPVPALVTAIGAKLHLQVPTNYIIKTKNTKPLKDMDDNQKRHEELKDAFKIADERYKGCHVLLFDDLFRSGETLNAISAVLISQGEVNKVSVLTATMTRAKR